jgi:hypothetical protein
VAVSINLSVKTRFSSSFRARPKWNHGKRTLRGYLGPYSGGVVGFIGKNCFAPYLEMTDQALGALDVGRLSRRYSYFQ